VHATYGWILEQHVYDTRGQLVASALNSNHRYYPELGVSLPHRIEIRLPPPNRSFHLDIDTYSINQLRVAPSQLFAMPSYPGYPMVDLTAPNGRQAPAVSHTPPPLTTNPPAYPAVGYPVTGFRPRYRGYTGNRRSPDRR
jgi:hypothetical protein